VVEDVLVFVPFVVVVALVYDKTWIDVPEVAVVVFVVNAVMAEVVIVESLGQLFGRDTFP
jgi:hypothetical protein